MLIKEIDFFRDIFPAYPHQHELFEAFFSGEYRFFVENIHRRGGKDATFFNLAWLFAAIERGNYLYTLPKIGQAQNVIWEGTDLEGRRWIDTIPRHLLAREPNQTQRKIYFTSGSMLHITGADSILDSHLGSNLRGIYMSEYQRTSPAVWDYLRPIINRNPKAFACFNFTSLGKGHAYKLMQANKDNPHWHCRKLTVDDTRDNDGNYIFSPEQVEEERRSGMDEDLIQQEYYCLPPDTLITTSRGAKPIKDIGLSDVVITHTGRMRRVENIYSRSYKGDLISIKTFGNFRNLTLTPNHRVYVCNPSTQSYKWVRADNIKKGNYLCMPKLSTGIPLVSLGLIEILAAYITDGSFSKNQLQITVGHHEKERLNRLKDISIALGFSVSTSYSNTAINLNIKSTSLCDLILSECLSYSHEKIIPLGLIKGYEQEFLKCMIDGDGYTHKNDELFSYVTINLSLAYGLIAISNTLGYRSGLTLLRKEGRYNIQGRTGAQREAYTVRIRCGKPSKNIGALNIRSAKHAMLVKVRETEQEHYNGNVHNFAVQHDNSYVAEGRIVHNCDDSVAVKGTFFAEQLELAREEGRVQPSLEVYPALPVHTSWDLGQRDTNSIWFFQVIGVGEQQQFRYFLEHDHNYGDVDYYVQLLQNVQREYGFNVYGKHFMPHDVKSTEWSTGKSRRTMLMQKGLNVTVVPMMRVIERVQVARSNFSKCWFAESKCRNGLEALAASRAKYDPIDKSFSSDEVHDWASHASAAFQYGHVGWLESYNKPRLQQQQQYAKYRP